MLQIKTTIFIAGDSTACDYEESSRPMTGWGQMLSEFFTKEVRVINAALSGRSSKSFIDEGHLEPIQNQIQTGDFFLIQFGHNDQKEDTERHTEPESDYQTFLTRYIDVARSKGATPVLLTSVNRYRFDDAGRLIPTHGQYPAAMIGLGAALKVAVIDITEKSRVLFEELGPEQALKLFLNLEPNQHPNYPEGVADRTHFAPEGAFAIAKLVVDGIREQGLTLTQYVK
jgi:lysophospholipase L1-like esterase